MPGALEGIQILEFAGIGPGPFAGMMLADQGAEVILIERPGGLGKGDPRKDVLLRSRRSIVLDLKRPESAEVIKRLASRCDGLIEGMRPGVMERLGIGPDVLLDVNPRLVYGRMTGWGQSGPEANKPGHDINYIALSGVLDACGRPGDKPSAPINLIGDFGGGGMLLAFGMLAGILSAKQTGKGQVIDCAMTDGSALLSSMLWSMRAQNRWPGPRGTNHLDGGAHFYDTYETGDGRFIAVGAIEPQFYREFCRGLGVEGDPGFSRQMDRALWPELKRRVAEIIRTRTREEWIGIFADTEACVTPVLAAAEVAVHEHNVARNLLIPVDGILQPAPAPKFSQSPSAPPSMLGAPGSDTVAVLQQAGFEFETIDRMNQNGVFGSGLHLLDAAVRVN